MQGGTSEKHAHQDDLHKAPVCDQIAPWGFKVAGIAMFRLLDWPRLHRLSSPSLDDFAYDTWSKISSTNTTFMTVVYVATWNGSRLAHDFCGIVWVFSIASICEATRDCAYSWLHGCVKKPFGQQRYWVELRCIPLRISIWSHVHVILSGGFPCPYF